MVVTVYSFEVLRTRYVKIGYFFDTNTKELQNSRPVDGKVTQIYSEIFKI